MRSTLIFTIRFFLWLAIATPVLNQIVRAEDELGGDGVAYYEKNIRPLLARHCYQCHSKRAKELQGELLLDSRDGWMTSGQNGPSVMTVEPESSSLLRAVRYNDPDLQMPPIAPLAAEDIAKLEHWVRIGAPGPSDDAVIAMVEASDPIAGKSHWAFQPLSSDPLPSDNSEWSRSSIDRYVVAQQESKGLHPVSDADSVDLARRIFFQLIGLPPTQQEINEFISDEPSRALPRLVDRCSHRLNLENAGGGIGSILLGTPIRMDSTRISSFAKRGDIAIGSLMHSTEICRLIGLSWSNLLAISSHSILSINAISSVLRLDSW